MPQTTVQKTNAIKTGSGLLEVGTTTGSLVNVGAIRNLAFNPKTENPEIEFDNTDPIKQFKNGQRASITCDLMEVDFDTINLIDAGLVTKTTTAASPVSVTGEALGTGWTVGQPIKLENKNGANTEVASIVIDAAGSALVLDTDYHVYVGDGTNGTLGYTHIVPITVQAGVLDADYDYTPNASKNLAFNDFGTKTLKYARITNTNSAGSTYIIDMEDVTNILPLVQAFLSDDADDVMGIPIELDGKITSLTDAQSIV